MRSRFERYEEKSYFRIQKVEALPTPVEDPKKTRDQKIYQAERKCIVLAEKVFRGRKYDKLSRLESATYKADFRLLSKKEEAEYCVVAPREEKLIAPYMEFPPLLKEFIMKETGRSDVKLKVAHKPNPESISRLAKEGENPTVEVAMGIGKPHPSGAILYEGLNI